MAWCQRCGTNLWEGVWPHFDPWDIVRLRTASTHWNVPRKYGPHGELFSFLLEKGRTVLSELIEFGPCISAEPAKACALIGLHMMAEENALRSDSDSSLDFGTCGGTTAQKNTVWGSNVVDLAGSEGTPSLEYHEHNVGNLAVEVVWQTWSSEVITLYLRDWEVGRVASSCHLPMDFLWQEMRDACWVSSESLGSPRSRCSECH